MTSFVLNEKALSAATEAPAVVADRPAAGGDAGGAGAAAFCRRSRRSLPSSRTVNAAKPGAPAAARATSARSSRPRPRRALGRPARSPARRATVPPTRARRGVVLLEHDGLGARPLDWARPRRLRASPAGADDERLGVTAPPGKRIETSKSGRGREGEPARGGAGQVGDDSVHRSSPSPPCGHDW